MAEFSKVMHNIQRRCDLCSQGEDIGCTIKGLICARISGMPHDADWRALEVEVMRWAAEHPEPVYPTWLEWFVSRGEYNEADDGNVNVKVGVSILLKRIPADIAQKLGIEPKEE